MGEGLYLKKEEHKYFHFLDIPIKEPQEKEIREPIFEKIIKEKNVKLFYDICDKLKNKDISYNRKVEYDVEDLKGE